MDRTAGAIRSPQDQPGIVDPSKTLEGDRESVNLRAFVRSGQVEDWELSALRASEDYAWEASTSNAAELPGFGLMGAFVGEDARV